MSAPFWNFTQRRVEVCYRRFGDNLSVPPSIVVDYLNLEDGHDSMSRNVFNKPPFYAASNPRRGQITYTRRREPEVKHKHVLAYSIFS
jgi:hypothetical protein